MIKNRNAEELQIISPLRRTDNCLASRFRRSLLYPDSQRNAVYSLKNCCRM
ncbi:MAG: hypothetical protein LBE04_07975 [Prevotellaceae bacterium]|nr:hypothetical protein [Prevotellaceae bacterium]